MWVWNSASSETKNYEVHFFAAFCREYRGSRVAARVASLLRHLYFDIFVAGGPNLVLARGRIKFDRLTTRLTIVTYDTIIILHIHWLNGQ